MQKEHEKFLLFRIRRFKDQKAFDELYKENAPMVQRFLRYKTPTITEAEDLTAEVFISFWNYAQTAHVDRVQGLLYKIARNVCANYYRKRATRNEAELEDADDVVSKGSVEEEVSAVLSFEAVEKHLKHLKEEYQEVLIMRYLQEMTIREIADVLERSENAVRVLVHRSLKAIRRIMDDYYANRTGSHQISEEASE